MRLQSEAFQASPKYEGGEAALRLANRSPELLHQSQQGKPKTLGFLRVS